MPLTAKKVNALFNPQLKAIVKATNDDFLERGIRVCQTKEGTYFLGGHDDLHGHLIPGEPDVGTPIETSFGGCPDESKNGYVGIGTIHTHPEPETNGPSPADLNTFGNNAQSRKHPNLFHWDDKPYGKSELDCIIDGKGNMLCLSGVDRGSATAYQIMYALGGDKEMEKCMKQIAAKYPDEDITDLESGVDIGIIGEIEKSCADPYFNRFATQNKIAISEVTL